MVPLAAVADPRWDYVALGHIHRFQNLTAGQVGVPPVVYSGSIERIDFGEEADTKGFCWVELARGATRWDFVTFDAISEAEDPEYRPRRFVTLKANLTDSDDPTQDVIRLMARYDLRAAVVRLILDLSPETDALLNEAAVRDEGKRRGVFQLLLQKVIAQPARLRLGGSPEGLTPAELLERYLITKEVLAERRAELLAAAQPIFEPPE
jgi:exonuclease SbcD